MTLHHSATQLPPQNYPQFPKAVWNRFWEITQIPRPSRHEGKMRDYLVSLAKSKGYEYRIDNYGNTVIYVPATPGFETHAPVIIQGHLDMVCDATADRQINFQEDPIALVVDGDWLKADRTTLGSDNGIGVAMALAVMDSPEVKHPPLELLFTVEEEIGLFGAVNLDTTLLQGKKLINIDTEDWGKLYVGCAGGMDNKLYGSFGMKAPESGRVALKCFMSGLRGGHSGVDIHRQRGSALQLLTEYLTTLPKNLDWELSEIRGGKAHNIIPREASAILFVNAADIKVFQEWAESSVAKWKTYLPEEDHRLSLAVTTLTDAEVAEKQVLVPSEKKRLLSLMSLLPHGVYKFCHDSPTPLVGLSCNWAKIELPSTGKLFIESSLRFFEENEVPLLRRQIDALAHAFDLESEFNAGYPSWRPQFTGNSLLELTKEIYQEQSGEVAEILAIHAGLECGVLRDKLGKHLEAVSFGPTILSAHSPSERVQISTVTPCWNLFVGLLARL